MVYSLCEVFRPSRQVALFITCVGLGKGLQPQRPRSSLSQSPISSFCYARASFGLWQRGLADINRKPPDYGVQAPKPPQYTIIE
jgi:hypothetical protein